jgi:hypothetical protein
VRQMVIYRIELSCARKVCGAEMYKHAPKFRRTARDDPDPSEILDAAGIDPRGTPEFVHEVKFAVKRGGKKTKNYSELARYLNDLNIRIPLDA